MPISRRMKQSQLPPRSFPGTKRKPARLTVEVARFRGNNVKKQKSR